MRVVQEFFHHHGWLIFGMVTSVVVVVAMLAWRAGVFDEVVQALTPKEENFTELYFEEHEKLPQIVIPSEVQHFSYSIHNHEHQKMTYPVEISLEEMDSTEAARIISTDSYTLDDDTIETVPVSFPFPSVSKLRAKVIIRLVNQDQTIHFWVSIPGSATQSATIDLENN